MPKFVQFTRTTNMRFAERISSELLVAEYGVRPRALGASKSEMQKQSVGASETVADHNKKGQFVSDRPISLFVNAEE